MDYLWIVYGFLEFAIVFTMIPIVFYAVSGTIGCKSYVFCNESGIIERGCIFITIPIVFIMHLALLNANSVVFAMILTVLIAYSIVFQMLLGSF